MGWVSGFFKNQSMKEDLRVAKQASSDALDTKSHMRELEHRIEDLSVVLNAVWALVQRQGSLTQKDLVEMVNELGLDQASEQATKCLQCGRPLSSRHRKCMYCGAER